jgi:hypothetical protein
MVNLENVVMIELVYLDYQIVDHLLKGEKPAIEKRVAQLRKEGVAFPYSPAHIEEIAVPVQRHNMTNHEPRLEYISQLSNDTSLLPFLRSDVPVIECRGVYVCTEAPQKCYGRVVANYKNNDYAEKNEKDFLKAARGSIFWNDPIDANNKKRARNFQLPNGRNSSSEFSSDWRNAWL